ncbi:LysR family substrate-binding domain-containing protein [Nocardia sp. IFM 10818]
MLEGRFDIAVQRLPRLDHRLTVRQWYSEPLTLFLPQEHPLAQGPRRPLPPVPRHRLGETPLVLWPREISPPLYDEIIALYHEAGAVPRIAAEGRSVQTVLALVAAGFGAAVLADSLRVLRRVGVTPRPIEGTRSNRHLVFRSGEENPVVSMFLGLAEEVRPAAP